MLDVVHIFSYNVIKKLGEGSFGNVYEVNNEVNNEQEVNNEEEVDNNFALKVIKNEENGITSLRELDIMGRLRHPNLMHAERIICQDGKTGILMQKAETDLFHKMYEKNFTIPERLKVLHSISKGLNFLHESGYLHLDLKPCNILIFQDNLAKITDFGLAIRLEKDSKYYPVKLTTVDYRPINVIDGDRNYSEKDDIWSLALIFLNVLSSGRSLFSNFKKKDFNSKKVKERYIEKLSPEVIDDTLNSYLYNLKKKLRKKFVELLKNMLIFDKKDRASLNDILEFFNDLGYIDDEQGSYIQPVIEKYETDLMNYKGFDILVRLATNIPIQLETFFLAADIYQRCLSFRRRSEDEEIDYVYITYVATLSLYMACKMVETYHVDPKHFTKLAEDSFLPENLIEGESALMETWQGVLYPSNLFTYSSTFHRFEQAFYISKNSFIYRKLDLETWRDENNKEEIVVGEYEKYTNFISFLSNTAYYTLMIEDKDKNYIKEMYENDKKEFS